MTEKERVFVQIVEAPKGAWYEQHIGEVFEVSNDRFIDGNNINVHFKNTISIYVVERGDYKRLVMHENQDAPQGTKE